ncbi:APC family permease [Algoriphagus sediminis]|uniref:APC family permease n=1 Tax=Algoriphagus sediminis TaxID=3057113 RepID=A0ABT7YAM2_9BACT|nr:APC family permease [Algoriphagus sediminis]MDN3203559.1 APC family permease [Algoriphagus sediminis]
MTDPRSKISWKTATSIVVANMIGTGVFTSLGFQFISTDDSAAILLAWLLGGLLAFIGALIYAELGTHFKKSGGDYVFLSETIHPSFGYLYSWVSLTVGFSAPIAIAAMAMNRYLSPITNDSILPGLVALLFIPLVHIFSIQRSARFHNLFTAFKICFILGLIFWGLGAKATPNNALSFSNNWYKGLWSPGYAVSMVYIFYAFTGWNSAAYIVSEIENPRKNLPKALLLASILVTIIYLGFQFVLLKLGTLGEMSGQIEVALIAFKNVTGETGILIIGSLIGLQLIATISGYLWVGPRITQAMGKDFRLWEFVGKSNQSGIPVRAVLLNTLISLLLFLTGSFDQVMVYAGFILQLMGCVTIYASLKLKMRTGFRAPFRPWLQIGYLIISLLILAYIFWERPKESLLGLGLLAVGSLLFVFDKKVTRKN